MLLLTSCLPLGSALGAGGGYLVAVAQWHAPLLQAAQVHPWGLVNPPPTVNGRNATRIWLPDS